MDCPITHDTDSNSRKAWQSLKDKGAVQTPAITERVSGEFSQVQVGRYFLKDVPSESMLRVQMTNLPVEDTGLYRCVIYQPPKDPIILFYLVHLVDQERVTWGWGVEGGESQDGWGWSSGGSTNGAVAQDF